jgi:predicted kinase
MNIDKFNNWLQEAAEGKKNFYILIGPPAVGKSTWVKQHVGEDAKIISKDDIIEDIIFPKYNLANKDIFTHAGDLEVGKEHPEKKKLGKVRLNKRFSVSQNKEVETKVFDIAYKAGEELNSIYDKRMQEAINSGVNNIVVDAVHSRKSTRKSTIDLVRDNPQYKIIGVIFPFKGYEKQIQKSADERAKKFLELYGPDFDRSVSPEDYQKIYSEYENPSKSEGFDEIINFNRFEKNDSEVFKGDNIEENFMEWLNEARLSKYWKQRSEARAKHARRESKNKIDREWAMLQQEKSRAMNHKIHKIFEKEMEMTEELSEEITQFIERVKAKREELRKKLEEKAKFKSPKEPRKKKTLPNPYKDAKVDSKYPFSKDRTGGVAKVYRKRSKAATGATAAPGEAFGPGE